MTVNPPQAPTTQRHSARVLEWVKHRRWELAGVAIGLLALALGVVFWLYPRSAEPGTPPPAPNNEAHSAQAPAPKDDSKPPDVPDVDPRLEYCPAARRAIPPDTGQFGLRSAGSRGLTTETWSGNVTCGDTAYSPVTGATYDQVVKVQLWYGNYGSDKPVDDVSIALRLSNMGTTAFVDGILTSPREGAPLSSRTAVFMPQDGARLESIPGSIIWRHNISPPGEVPAYKDEKLPDTVVGQPFLLARVAAGENGEASVSALFRVKVRRIAVDAQLRSPSARALAETVAVSPGGDVAIAAEVKNLGNAILRRPVVRLLLAAGSLQYVNSSFSEGVGNDGHPAPQTDILTSGVETPDLGVGKTTTVTIMLRVLQGAPSGIVTVRVGARPLGEYEVFDAVTVKVSA